MYPWRKKPYNSESDSGEWDRDTNPDSDEADLDVSESLPPILGRLDPGNVYEKLNGARLLLYIYGGIIVILCSLMLLVTAATSKSSLDEMDEIRAYNGDSVAKEKMRTFLTRVLTFVFSYGLALGGCFIFLGYNIHKWPLPCILMGIALLMGLAGMGFNANPPRDSIVNPISFLFLVVCCVGVGVLFAAIGPALTLHQRRKSSLAQAREESEYARRRD